jgi:hypothetical protein
MDRVGVGFGRRPFCCSLSRMGGGKPERIAWNLIPWLVFAGVLGVLLLTSWIEWRCSPGRAECRSRLVEDFYDWQPLVAGILALIAGIISVRAIFKQTEAHERQAAERRDRLVRAYRASLSDDLALVANHAKSSAGAAHEMLRVPNRPITTTPLNTPSLEGQPVIDHLRMLIENHDARSGEVFADLLGCYQVQHYRLAGQIDLYNPPSFRNLADPTGISSRPHVIFTLFATVALYLRATQLLPWARRQVETIEAPTFDEKSIISALFQMGLFDSLNPEERKRICEALLTDKPLTGRTDSR